MILQFCYVSGIKEVVNLSHTLPFLVGSCSCFEKEIQIVIGASGFFIATFIVINVAL